MNLLLGVLYGNFPEQVLFNTPFSGIMGGILGAILGFYFGLVSIPLGFLIEEDALLLTKIPTLRNWKLISKPTGFTGTFKLETIRNAKGYPLDASFFGV